MRVLKIVILTLLISFLLFAASVYITFKYILTPERIKNYVKSYIETTVNEQFEKYKTEMLDKISLSNFMDTTKVESEKVDENIESFNVLENVSDVNVLASKFTNMDMFRNLSDVNVLASKLFNSANIKMDILKYKISEYFSNKDKKEE